jgi:hypothetical protein
MERSDAPGAPPDLVEDLQMGSSGRDVLTQTHTKEGDIATLFGPPGTLNATLHEHHT